VWAGVCINAVVALIAVAFVSPARANEQFGIEKLENVFTMNEMGVPATRAGSHPYAMATTIMFNHQVLAEKNGTTQVAIGGDPKDIEVNLPTGVVVNPTATETRCTEAEMESRAGCANAAAVGVVTLYLNFFGGRVGEAVYNMVPPPGVPAELAFNGAGIGIIVHILGKLRTGGDYGLSGDVSNIPQKHPVYGTKLTLWGDPSGMSHDKERGSCSTGAGREKVKTEEQEIHEKGEEPNRVYFCPVERTGRPLLTMPGSCGGEPVKTTMSADSWQEPGHLLSAESASPALTGCERLDFSPSLRVQPDTTTAESPSGLNFDLKIPQEESLGGLAEANLKDTVVTLPAGMAISPSAANGLGACTPEEIGLSNANAPSCPDSSKIGSTEVVTLLLEHPLKGSVFLAQQTNNPFGSLLALYLVAEGSGALIKLAGHVEADPVTGRLTTSFKNNPQLPFSDLKLQFFGGAGAPLITPPTCGIYETKSSLTPWSGIPAATLSDTFSVTSGPGGGPCPAGQFAPSFTAGTTNNQAGGFSSFSVTFSRQDGEQRLGSVQVTTPPGLLGALKSVAQCPEPQASQGACGPESMIGHTTTGAGPGPDPFYVGGNVFLTGPYKGAPFGLSIVVHALAGPFDLGNVIVRARVNVDPFTAQITVTSDPLPTILQGIPLDLRTVNVTIDRPGFMFNPTNCSPLSVGGTIASTSGTSAPVSSPFQAGNCANLPFKPSFTVSTQARTSKANGASLHVKVASGAGQANIGRVAVILPKQLPARLTTLQKACVDSVFNANPAACPAASLIGTATAVTPLLNNPLTGPAYLVSHGGVAFPDLVILLQGEGITLYLDGNTNIKKGITSSTFNSVPDAPVSTFDLVLPEGPHSALAANTPAKARGSLCSTSLVMPTTITGQNGAVLKQSTKIAVTGCPKAKKTKKARRASNAAHRGGKGRK
jgi:hypothetical protein